MIHHAGYRMYAYGDQTFSFHRPDGTAIPTAAASPGGQADHPERSNHDLDLPVDADSLPPDWDGMPPDYDAAAQALLDATFPRNADDEHNIPRHHPVSAERHSPVSAEGHERVSAERPSRPPPRVPGAGFGDTAGNPHEGDVEKPLGPASSKAGA